MHRETILAASVVVVAAAVAIPLGLSSSSSAATALPAREFNAVVTGTLAPYPLLLDVFFNVANNGTETAKADCHVTVVGFRAQHENGQVNGFIRAQPPGTDWSAEAELEGLGAQLVKRSQVSVSCT